MVEIRHNSLFRLLEHIRSKSQTKKTLATLNLIYYSNVSYWHVPSDRSETVFKRRRILAEKRFTSDMTPRQFEV